jgi:hypothetical protein
MTHYEVESLDRISILTMESDPLRGSEAPAYPSLEHQGLRNPRLTLNDYMFPRTFPPSGCVFLPVHQA